MSATLKSFDINDDSSIAFRKIPSPTLKSLNKRDQNNSNSENVHHNDDIEFDDTRMDMTDELRMSGSQKIDNLFHTKDRFDSSQQHDFVIRNTTTKVPLRDSPHTQVSRNSINVSTPDMLNRANKYRSKNGTPLKLPPLNSNQFSSDSDSENKGLPIEQKIEDSLIKHRKLISDDNKFSPGSAQVSVKELSRNNSNGETYTSPTKKMNKQLNETVITPPSNLKVRPLMFYSGSKIRPQLSELKERLPFEIENKKSSNSLREGDIEFDSSDVEDDGIGEKGRPSITPKVKEPAVDRTSPPRLASQQGIKTNDYKQVDDRTGEISVPKNSTNRLFEKDLKKTKSIVSDDTHQNEKYADISRAEILEKINNTINSLMEKDRIASSPSKINVENVLPETIDMELEKELSSDESPEEILNELDSFFGANKSNAEKHKENDTSYKSLSKHTLNSDEFHSIPKKNALRATPIRSHYSRLSGKYAKQILQKRRNFSENTAMDQDLENVLPIMNNDLQNTEWSTRKWQKLNRVLQLEKVSMTDILNSEVLLQSLGCASKRELKQRIEFLNQVNESRKMKQRRKNIINAKTNSLASKSSKFNKRSQIL